MHGITKFDPTLTVAIVVTLVGCVAAWTDLRRAKIYNWLTLPTLLMGIAFQFLFLGATAGFDALWAVGLAWVLLGWMYALRFMGAGDVKLLMALGAWVGTKQVIEIALLAIVIGALLGATQLLRHGKLLDFLRRAWLLILSFVVKDLKHVRPGLDRKLKLPFGVALALASVITVFFHPLRSVMVVPW